MGDTIKAYSQWVAVRSTIQRLLYVVANSNTMRNGYVQSAWGNNDAVEVTFATNENINVPLGAYANVPKDVDITYMLTSELPEGLHFDGKTGAIFGQVAEAGDYTVTVATYAGDEWAGYGLSEGKYADKTFTIKVIAPEAEALKTQMETLSATLDELSAKVDALETSTNEDLTAIKADLAELQTKLNGTDTDVEALKTDLAALQTKVTELESLQTKVADLETKVNESGCNSSINAATGIIIGTSMLGVCAAAVVIGNRRRKQNDK